MSTAVRFPAIVLETGKDEHGHQHSRHPSDMVDLGRWERVPLPRWYAIVEALDGEKVTAGEPLAPSEADAGPRGR